MSGDAKGAKRPLGHPLDGGLGLTPHLFCSACRQFERRTRTNDFSIDDSGRLRVFGIPKDMLSFGLQIDAPLRGVIYGG